RPHHAEQRDLVAVLVELSPKGIDLDLTAAVGREPAHARPLLASQPMDRVEDGVVLDRRGDHPVASRIRLAPGPEDSLDGEVVALRSPACDEAVRGAGTQ